MANLLVTVDAFAAQNGELLAIGRQKWPVSVVQSDTLTPNWATVLAVGAASGGTNPLISAGDVLEFAPNLGSINGYIRMSGTTLLVHGADNGAGTGEDVAVVGGNGTTVGGNASVRSGLPISGADPTAGIQHPDEAWAVAVRDTGVAHTGGQAILVDSSGLAFFDGTTVTKPSVTGAKGGNAALTSLLTTLANMGLITDNTT